MEEKKETIVYLAGVWDLFHVGHLNVIKSAKKLGDKLVIGVNTDELIMEYKGKPPIIPYNERCEIIRSLKYVDEVVPQVELGGIQTLKNLSPDIYATGDDWKGKYVEGIEWIKSQPGKSVVYLPRTSGISTTELKEKMPSQKVEKKVALITGASSGVGLSVAKSLQVRGYQLALISRKKENLQKSFNEDENILFLEHDLESETNMELLVNEVTQKFGKIDLLINNAATTTRAEFKSATKEDLDKVFNVNLKSIFFLSQLVSNVMLKHKSGNIINISSISGINAYSTSVQYGISKGALITLTKYLAKILAPHINVNCIAPGFIDTNWHKSPVLKEIISPKIPLKRFAKPQEIADLCLFLATKGKYITGETIVIDGGYSL